MNKSIYKSISLTVLLLTSQIPVMASANDVHLGNVAYSGTACPGGSVAVNLNPSKTQLSINFNQYVVEAKGRNQTNSRKTCTIAIPIKVPKGLSVSLVAASYNGKVALPQGSHARVIHAYSFLGRSGGKFMTDFHGPNTNGYSLRDSLSGLASVWSGCGQDTVLRITTSTRVKTDGTDTTTLADSGQGVITQLRYRSCQ